MISNYGIEEEEEVEVGFLGVKVCILHHNLHLQTLHLEKKNVFRNKNTFLLREVMNMMQSF
jgi:hypothetical protein